MNEERRERKIKKLQKMAELQMEDKDYERRLIDHNYDSMLRAIGLHESC